MNRRKIGFCMSAVIAFSAVFGGGFAQAEQRGTDGRQAGGTSGIISQADSWQTGPEELPDRTQAARTALHSLSDRREIMAVVWLCPEYAVKSEADLGSETVVTVPSGQTVFIRDFIRDDDGAVWIRVSLYRGEREYQGFIEREHLACSDERFTAWEAAYPVASDLLWEAPVFTVSGNIGFSTRNSFQKSDEDEKAEMLEQFPESYRPGLEALSEEHPDWIFVPLNTGLTWKTVIDNELLDGRSLVHRSLPDYTKEGVYDDNNWYYASRKILEYYMDPRNGLTEGAIFQFEQLTYNESYHTKESLEAFLEKTFMNSDTCAPDTDMTYAQIFHGVGSEDDLGVSPFHLAARVYQEQGSASSPLISGTYPGFEHLYNHFNIGATGRTTQEVIVNGLTYAKNARNYKNPAEPMPWKNAYYSILGGAYFISSGYIRRGQDSLYLQKFNVNPSAAAALYTHQYMQNISAPASEARKIRDMYESADSLDCAFVFTIPVFQKMPAKPCAMPTSSKSVVLKVPEGFDGSRIYLDGNPVTTEVRNGYSIATAKNTKAKTAAVYRYDEEGEPAEIHVWVLAYENKMYVTWEQPEFVNIMPYVGYFESDDVYLKARQFMHLHSSEDFGMIGEDKERRLP